jgi:peptide/nickel transport system ATP-binding protein
MNSVIEVSGLSVDLDLPAGTLHAVQNIGFSVGRGETLSLVGESGCGKSLTALAVMNLLPPTGSFRADTLSFEGQSLLGLKESAMADIRGNRIAMIFQEPMTSLNPSYTIGNQLKEALQRHRKVTAKQARERAVFLLEKVGITAADSRLQQYPHQLSGGLRQRVMIAMGLMCGPSLIIADEPTTALDVTIQAQILELLHTIQNEFEMGLILSTHDLGVVARMADRVAVMYCGQMVETGRAADIFNDPKHPYTLGLLECIPVPGRLNPGQKLGSIPGLVPTPIGNLRGCLFRNRCSRARSECAEGQIPVARQGPHRTLRCLDAPSDWERITN